MQLPPSPESPVMSPSPPTTTPNTHPDTPPLAPMPSPGSYHSAPYQHIRNGSAGTSSSRYRYGQLPSPADSRSSRGHSVHDVDTGFAHVGERTTHSANTRNSPMATDSLEYLPVFPEVVSRNSPALHFLLARDTAQANGFTIDMRLDPIMSIYRNVLEGYGGMWISRERSVHMRIVSEDFPWVIEIRADEEVEATRRGLTIVQVWTQIYAELQVPINESEWAILCEMSTREPIARRRHEYLLGVARQRLHSGEDVPLIRLDWLMGKTVFTGLEKDSDYRLTARRVLPGRERGPETWVAHFIEGN